MFVKTSINSNSNRAINHQNNYYYAAFVSNYFSTKYRIYLCGKCFLIPYNPTEIQPKKKWFCWSDLTQDSPTWPQGGDFSSFLEIPPPTPSHPPFPPPSFPLPTLPLAPSRPFGSGASIIIYHGPKFKKISTFPLKNRTCSLWAIPRQVCKSWWINHLRNQNILLADRSNDVFVKC